MLAEVIFKRSARSVADSSEETLIAPTATLIAIMVRNPRRSLSYAIASGGTTLSFQQSIVQSGTVVTLENDAGSVSADKYYGTDGAGVKGYHPLPTGSANAFTDLTDVPGSYSGETLKIPRVNAAETGLEFVALSTLSTNIVSDTAYDPTTWDGDTSHAPSKNAVRDKIESMASLVDDTAYDATTWNADTTHAPSKNAVRDKIEALASPVDDTAYDATTWNGDTTHAPSKNAIRDKIESLSSGGAPTTAAFLTAQSEAGLSAEVNLGALTTGLLKHAVTAGVSVPSTAVADTDYVTPAGTGTLTNKRVNPRVTSIASNATWSPNADTDDVYEITAQAVAVTTISNPSGTPVDGQSLIIRFKDDGTIRALTWSGSQWEAGIGSLPTNTVVGKHDYVGFKWNSTTSKWTMVASTQAIAVSLAANTLQVSGSDFTTTSAGLIAITGLLFAPAANSMYEIDILLRVQSSTSAGLKVGLMQGGSGALFPGWMLSGQADGSTGTSAFNTAVGTAFLSSLAVTANMDTFVWIKGILLTASSPGSISVGVFKVTSGTATVYIGSRMTYTQLR